MALARTSLSAHAPNVRRSSGGPRTSGAGAVELVHAAETFPDTHRLVLVGARPGVHRVLDRCGAPFAPQLEVVPREEAE